MSPIIYLDNIGQIRAGESELRSNPPTPLLSALEQRVPDGLEAGVDELEYELKF